MVLPYVNSLNVLQLATTGSLRNLFKKLFTEVNDKLSKLYVHQNSTKTGSNVGIYNYVMEFESKKKIFYKK